MKIYIINEFWGKKNVLCHIKWDKKATTRSCGELWFVEEWCKTIHLPITTYHMDKLWLFCANFYSTKRTQKKKKKDDDII